MKPELVQSFIIQNGSCFNSYQLPQIQKTLEELDDSKAAIVMGRGYHSTTLMLVIAIVLGWERFFLDDVVLGIVKVLTCYGFGIWWLIDLFSVTRRTQDYNFKKFNEAAMLCK